MKLFINNQPFDISKLTYRDLGYGEAVQDLPVAAFRWMLSVAELRVLITSAFDNFVLESRKDDERTGGSEAIPELVRHNYPSFEELYVRDRNALAKVIRKYLFFELLSAWLDGNSLEGVTMVINNIESIDFGDEEVRVTGQVFERRA